MITPNLGIVVWDQGDDKYDHIQLAINFTTIDAHDHTPGRGKRITTLAIQNLAVTTLKLADAAVTPAKLADSSVSNLKLVDDSVNSRVIATAAVGTTEIADRSVTSIKLAEPIRPLGEVITWWRPTTATPLPDDWVPCDGRALAAPAHDFAGGGTITVPNLVNKFVLGANTGGTGTGPTTPPAIGQAGGSNVANLTHTHTVPHSHAVDAHTHGVNAHNHAVDAHSHGLSPHNHVVQAHAHTVPSHTHNVSGHTHPISHAHYIPGHSHGIGADGFHGHSFAGGGTIFSRRSYIYPAFVGGTDDRQTLFIGGFNAGQTSNPAFMDAAGVHSHGGGTAYVDNYSHGTDTPSSGVSGAIAEDSAAFSTEVSTTETGYVGGESQVASPSTSFSSGSTTATAPGTSVDSPTTTAGLASEDVRPAYVGLLYLIKVKN